MPVPPKVLNPSFEDWTADDPDNWPLVASGSDTKDTAKFYDGVASDQLSISGGGNEVADATQTLEVKGFRNHKFLLKVYANGRIAISGHNSGAVVFAKADIPTTTLGQSTNDVENVWDLVEFTLTIPMNANQLTITLRNDKRSTEGFGPQLMNFDTVVLQHLGETEKRELSAVRTLVEPASLGSQALKQVLS